MSSTKNTSLEKIGYLNKIPEHSNIIDYESIIIKKKNGHEYKLYRKIQEINIEDEISNFKKSWQIFNNFI
tara:strand:- start:308 stop:517 length:210 start_codon:yes stop_codon:yes gene_type:complete